MLKKVAIAVGFLVSSASPFAYSLPMDGWFSSLIGRSGAPADDMTVEQALDRVANQINKNLPLEVDKHTRLDKVTHEARKQLTYHYTIVTLRSADVNKADFEKAMQPQLKKKLCESNEMKNFLKNGVSIAYSYRGSDAQPVGNFKYAPSDCGYKTRVRFNGN
jgi:hypothetical protein